MTLFSTTDTKRVIATCFLYSGCLFIISSAGCTTASSQPPRDTPQIVSIETVSDQALAEVMASPTTFRVVAGEEQTLWERARMFYLQYLGAPSLLPIEHARGPGQTVLNNETLESSKYIYEVTRESLPSGEYQLSIACAPRGRGATATLARRNAKNVSRFIREGTLELSFLDL